MRQQQWDKEELRLNHLQHSEGRKNNVKSKSYEEYAGPVQDTFDNIVANNLQLLRGATLEERAGRVKEHFKVAEVSCVLCVYGGCIRCVLGLSISIYRYNKK